MYAIFEDAGAFAAGRIISEAESSAQIELASGKRVKVKLAQIVLRAPALEPDAAGFLKAAQAAAAQVDLSLSWEFAPEDEFGFVDLARDYFSDKPSLAQQATMLYALHGAPHYFRRLGKGRFKKASAEVLQQALAAIERKRLQAEQIAAWAEQLQAGRAPPEISAQLFRILFKPDKSAAEYKAVVLAAQASKKPPLQLLREAGAIGSAFEFHWKRFALEYFPKGTGFGALLPPAMDEAALSLAPVPAFSIDDSKTTEIDDALSVQFQGDAVIVGIHIAAPGLAIAPGDALDAVARDRLSTLYMPGFKATMLPDSVVQHYTLEEGGARAALSLYATLDAQTLEVRATRSAIERVAIAHNLRYDRIEHIVTADWLSQQVWGHDLAPYLNENSNMSADLLHSLLSFLYRWAQHLKAQREVVRGKPENFNRPDYHFAVDSPPGALPRGDERVTITPRKRGSPLDLIVAEAMIFANSTWGAWLAQLGVPAIYRSQASLAPGIKVRMGTKPAPHAGMGVQCYAWATSPLRRYTDLVNQWQLIAAVRHGPTAALAAPFKPKDAQLLAIISAFDASYGAYNEFQTQMERYWTFQWLVQNERTVIEGVVIKDQPQVAVRADDLPLVVQLTGTPSVVRGERVRVQLGKPDLLDLTISASLIERLGPPLAGEAVADDESDEAPSGALHLAMDVNEVVDAPIATAAQ